MNTERVNMYSFNKGTQLGLLFREEDEKGNR